MQNKYLKFAIVFDIDCKKGKKNTKLNYFQVFLRHFLPFALV